jgi:hypothetical protein
MAQNGVARLYIVAAGATTFQRVQPALLNMPERHQFPRGDAFKIQGTKCSATTPVSQLQSRAMFII